MKLYHGSSAAVTRPDIARCRPNNDYGRGFYCTADVEMAKEWACQRGENGFVSCYEIDSADLHIINLNDRPFNILHWLEVLFENRLVRLATPQMQRGAAWLHENFPINLDDADIVSGYRADDSYFGFARAFLRNEITLSQLSRAMRLGDLGTQHMVKSPRAFKRLRYLGCEPADASRYWPPQTEREDAARWAFQELLAEEPGDSLYLSTLMTMDEEALHGCLR